MERDVKSFFKGAALDPLGRLNSPSPLSASLTSPHTVGSHPAPLTTSPLASSLTLYKRRSLLSEGSNV